MDAAENITDLEIHIFRLHAFKSDLKGYGLSQ
jgi:hypothetical protein